MSSNHRHAGGRSAVRSRRALLAAGVVALLALVTYLLAAKGAPRLHQRLSTEGSRFFGAGALSAGSHRGSGQGV